MDCNFLGHLRDTVAFVREVQGLTHGKHRKQQKVILRTFYSNCVREQKHLKRGQKTIQPHDVCKT